MVILHVQLAGPQIVRHSMQCTITIANLCFNRLHQVSGLLRTSLSNGASHKVGHPGTVSGARGGRC
jgi:hypothetical protein